MANYPPQILSMIEAIEEVTDSAVIKANESCVCQFCDYAWNSEQPDHIGTHGPTCPIPILKKIPKFILEQETTIDLVSRDLAVIKQRLTNIDLKL